MNQLFANVLFASALWAPVNFHGAGPQGSGGAGAIHFQHEDGFARKARLEALVRENLQREEEDAIAMLLCMIQADEL